MQAFCRCWFECEKWGKFVSNAGAVSVAPVSVKNETELVDIEALKDTNEKLSIENDRLQSEVERLRKNVAELDENTNKFEEALDTLLFITKQQEFNVDKSEKQVKQQKAVLDREKENKTTKVLQMLLSLIIKADSDGDFLMKLLICL